MTTDPANLDERMFEWDLDEAQKMLRDQFVDEYLKDYDPFRAAIRCKFSGPFAVEWSKRFMLEGYVQRRIMEITRKQRDLSDEEERLAHMENMRALSYNADTSSARIAAGKEFAEMKGWKKDNTAATAADDLVEAFKDIAKRLPV